MDAMGDLSQLVDRVFEVVSDVGEHAGQAIIAGRQVGGQLELDAHRHQTLLDPIVDIALDALALLVEGRHDAGEVADFREYAVAGTDTVMVVARSRPNIVARTRPDTCRSCRGWSHRVPPPGVPLSTTARAVSGRSAQRSLWRITVGASRTGLSRPAGRRGRQGSLSPSTIASLSLPAQSSRGRLSRLDGAMRRMT